MKIVLLLNFIFKILEKDQCLDVLIIKITRIQRFILSLFYSILYYT